MRARTLVTITLVGMFVGTLACGRAQVEEPPAAEPPASEVLTQKSESGPVRVELTLSPKKPRLGDPLTLTLTALAQPGVQVEMPPFGDALGRFSIASFTPRTESTPDGGTRHSQRYVLEVPMSGHQRIPSLRIEFTGGRADAGQADGGSTGHEILTDEIAVDVTSVLPEGDGGELRGLRDPLEETVSGTRRALYALGPAVLLGALAALLLFRRLRARAGQQARISAYDAAMRRMAELKARGWPTEQNVDAFYVELSDIVRRYIEDRYRVRAPELTTEEFLREARQQLQLQQSQREMLEAFLSTCDRVKFAGYRPGEFESRQAFGEAGRFLDDTRPARDAGTPGITATPSPPGAPRPPETGARPEDRPEARPEARP